MSKKIVFMGTPMFAVPILKSLYQNGYFISEVYTQPPKKSLRGQKINKSPVQHMAETLNLELRTPHSLKNNAEEYDYFKKIKPDLVIVVAYGQIIPKEYLILPKNGFINIHASILPSWRGAAPIQRSIMNLDKETGISIMKITEKLDSGPVSQIYKIGIKNENAMDISEKLSLIAAEKILDNVDDVLEGKAEFVEQEHSKATYAPKIEKTEGKINWNDSAEKIIGKINGLYPFPGAFFIFNGERHKILKAEISNGAGKVGEVISDNLEIACNNNQSIRVLKIHKQGKNPQNVRDFIRGSKIKKGFIIPNV